MNITRCAAPLPGLAHMLTEIAADHAAMAGEIRAEALVGMDPDLDRRTVESLLDLCVDARAFREKVRAIRKAFAPAPCPGCEKPLDNGESVTRYGDKEWHETCADEAAVMDMMDRHEDQGLERVWAAQETDDLDAGDCGIGGAE